MTKVKICGITDVLYARAAIEAGADLIGVVFAPSPRQVTYEKAQEMVATVKTQKHSLPVVGVFVNMLASTVNEMASFCGLDWVQLSGDETWEYCQQIERPVIKAIHVAQDRRFLLLMEKSALLPPQVPWQIYLQSMTHPVQMDRSSAIHLAGHGRQFYEDHQGLVVLNEKPGNPRS